ncbi:hypothetical protein [Trichormus variabilis]|uniref:Uncharacterized protein n=1 Tax=Trichormus variabilis SAG 1403-4b TaxID=447716 RepID=A0A433UYI0_ANAVA|nr:hypothetical protein [Trichormus variabilis]MBD2625653.1 hypothetical protein [Trichormus variabilis FACHB-164]RUS98934.1 hypothetical protein DSM107003_09530 [Trichormus variabilis SAG 1403-4b]
MTQPSNIRQLLTDAKLGLLPYLDNRLNEIEQSWQQLENLRLEPYDIELRKCHTIAANEPRPLITQSVCLKCFITGSVKDKLELLLLASELQNSVDATIFEWSNREWYQFEKPLRRPVTQITGGLDYELLENPDQSCRLVIYREFDLIYTISF